MIEFLKQPWPWYISGPVIGLMVPISLLIANKSFGVSSSLRHICAACMPGNIAFFKYNWRRELWNIFFVIGVLLGSFLAGRYLNSMEPLSISENTLTSLRELGLSDFNTYIPVEIFSWSNLFTLQGILFIAIGGFMVGFGARWAGGCTSGHAISGLSNFQFTSLVAVIGFFAGGLFITHFVFPFIF